MVSVSTSLRLEVENRCCRCGVIGFLMCLRAPERFTRYLALNTAHSWVPLDARSLLHMWRWF